MIIALLLQTTLSPIIKFNLVHPDLVVIVAMAWVILRGLEEGLMYALVGGLSLDFTSGAPFGLFSFTMVLVAVATSIAHNRIFGLNNKMLPSSLILPLSFLFNGAALLILAILGRPVEWDFTVANIITPAAFYNTAVMLFTFPLLYFLNRLLEPPQPLPF